MLSLADLAQYPNALADDYRRAAVGARIMLTGHVHQAPPDIAEKGYAEHWDCLARYGEERWGKVAEKAQQVRAGFAGLIDDNIANIVLGASVHELFLHFLSALPLAVRPRIITTEDEHPSVLGQLLRLGEFGVEVIVVPGAPAADTVERVGALIDDKTAAVCLASVSYRSGHQVLELDTLLPLCQQRGVELFVDAYQSINVLPFSMRDYKLDQAFVMGGGASYCQMGAGNCFMHIPPGRHFRPVIIGGRPSVDPLAADAASPVPARGDGATGFSGSTSSDALPHFRACHVFDYFRRRGLGPDFLYDVNRHQLSLLARAFHGLELSPALIELTADIGYMGGMIAFSSPHARVLCEKMRDRGVHTDYCDHWLRMGPAPYLCDEQLEDAILALEEAVNELG